MAALHRLLYKLSFHLQWRNRRVGAECPPETSDREISADLPGKKEVRKKEKRGGEWRRKEEQL